MIKDTDKKKEAMTRIEMRISKEDKAIIEQKARKTGLTTSEFVRRSALGRRLPCYGDTTLLQEYSMQLGKIGSCRELLNLKFQILPALEDVACGKKYQKKTKSTASGKESG